MDIAKKPEGEFPAASLNHGEKTEERPTERELLSNARAGAGAPLKGSHRPAMARCTAMVAAKFVINRSHGDGSPAFGAEVNSTQEKPLVFTYLDPEKCGRSIGQQVDAYIAVIERQAAEELENQSAP